MLAYIPADHFPVKMEDSEKENQEIYGDAFRPSGMHLFAIIWEGGSVNDYEKRGVERGVLLKMCE